MTLFHKVLSLCELDYFSDLLISLKYHLSSKLLFLCYSFLLGTFLVMICWNLLEVCNVETLVEDITVSLFMLYIDFLTGNSHWHKCVFILSQTGTSIQGHLDSIGESLQPYLLAVGPKRSRVHSWFIVIDQHALPCKASNSLACVDELFKAHFVFGTSYCQELTNVYSFLQTTVYDIDVETTKVNPRVAELRARILQWANDLFHL